LSPFSEPRVGSGAAVIADGRILLLKRRTDPEAGCWGILGGKIDLFETAVETARREAEEEAGIRVTACEWLCFVDQIDRAAGSHWVSPVYLVTAFEGTPRLMEPDKHSALQWFDLTGLPAELTIATKRAVEAFAARG
jgi:ADP-ribose pyrophosphatase YjhB (NUDIX family)